MAYTRVWSEAIPAGTDAASSIDDSVRALRLDIRERMTDLVNSWSADPVVAQDKITGKAASKQLIIAPYAFDTGGAYSVPPDDKKLWIGTANARCSVEIPAGCTITAVDVLIDNNPGNVTINFKRVTYDAAETVTTLATVVSASTGVVIRALAGAGLPHLVLTNNRYLIECIPVGGTSMGIHGARITYDTPDSRFTR